jgi:hypothetical protein
MLAEIQKSANEFDGKPRSLESKHLCALAHGTCPLSRDPLNHHDPHLKLLFLSPQVIHMHIHTRVHVVE